MSYLHGKTINEQRLTAELTLGALQKWPERRQEKTGAAAAFARSAADSFTPSAVRGFFARLRARDRLLSDFGWILLLSVPAFALLSYFQVSMAHAANPWFKPIKFAVSFATFVWTVSLFLLHLKIPARVLQSVRLIMVGSITLEMLCLAAQAWRNSAGVPAASGTTDWLIAQMTTAMVSVNTAILCGLLAVFCGKAERIMIADSAMVLAVRLSIVIFLLGNAVGGYMLARGSHTVGAGDGGPGLPFLNWSTVAGDLRIAHFIAIHAIQIVPLFAYLSGQMTPRPALRLRRMGVYAVAALVSLLVGGTFVQAMLAHPMIPLAR
jgi:hypothetical protein